MPELPTVRHVPVRRRVKGTRRALAVSATAQARSKRLDTAAERAIVAKLRAQQVTERGQAAAAPVGRAHMASLHQQRPGSRSTRNAEAVQPCPSSRVSVGRVTTGDRGDGSVGGRKVGDGACGRRNGSDHRHAGQRGSTAATDSSSA
ncbi:hypothetical protein HC928_08165 [bacterium]|nr:hypothetical protein [bacterium]